jgi:hypothetical protein
MLWFLPDTFLMSKDSQEKPLYPLNAPMQWCEFHNNQNALSIKIHDEIINSIRSIISFQDNYLKDKFEFYHEDVLDIAEQIVSFGKNNQNENIANVFELLSFYHPELRYTIYIPEFVRIFPEEMLQLRCSVDKILHSYLPNASKVLQIQQEVEAENAIQEVQKDLDTCIEELGSTSIENIYQGVVKFLLSEEFRNKIPNDQKITAYRMLIEKFVQNDCNYSQLLQYIIRLQQDVEFIGSDDISDIEENIIVSHYIGSAMQRADSKYSSVKEGKQIFLLGLQGVGKSSFVNFLYDNLQAKILPKGFWGVVEKKHGTAEVSNVHYPLIGHSFKTTTIDPISYKIQHINASIWDTPSIEPTLPYAQEIISQYNLYSAIKNSNNIALIPVFSWESMHKSSADFIHALDTIEHMFSDCKFSNYVITGAPNNGRARTEQVLKVVEREISDSDINGAVLCDMIQRVKHNNGMIIVPKPVNGKFITDHMFLQNTASILNSTKNIENSNMKFYISDSARIRVKDLVSVWDEVLVTKLDLFSKKIICPIMFKIYDSKGEVGWKLLKKFKNDVNDIRDVSDFVYNENVSCYQLCEDIADDSFFKKIAENLKELLCYRDTLAMTTGAADNETTILNKYFHNTKKYIMDVITHKFMEQVTADLKKQEMNFLIDMSHIDYNAEISVLKDEYNSYSSSIENIDQLEICGASSNEEF